MFFWLFTFWLVRCQISETFEKCFSIVSVIAAIWYLFQAQFGIGNALA